MRNSIPEAAKPVVNIANGTAFLIENRTDSVRSKTVIITSFVMLRWNWLSQDEM